MAGGTSTHHRIHKRIISDQQRRRDVALERQQQQRRDLQRHVRALASTFAKLSPEGPKATEGFIEEEEEFSLDSDIDQEPQTDKDDAEQPGLYEGTRLRGAEARRWFADQFMLPEWMIDVPVRLQKDWVVMPRPAGKRCIVVSSRGMTISRLRNGHILHCFPSALPNGARNPGVAAAAHIFCILDCVFHEPDATYYVLDVMCWRGYSLYDCAMEFRLFWRDSKLSETGIFSPLSAFHKYQFSLVPAYDCNKEGLNAAYSGQTSFSRDGMLFYNRHAHYVLGHTPLALIWKDDRCSQYYLDTDSKGVVPTLQQVVLELKSDGSVVTSDDPPVVLGTMPKQFLEENSKYLKPGVLLRFAIGTDGLKIIDGKPVAADIHYQGPASRFRPEADSCTKILFQYAARHAPITVQDIVAAIELPDESEDYAMDG